MDCNNTLASIESVIRQIGHVKADGCARLLIEKTDAGDPLACDSDNSLLTTLLASLNSDSNAILCSIKEVDFADLCTVYTPRITCDSRLSLQEALLECATIVTGTSAWIITGAGTEAANGTYCLDGEENGAPVWTKVGGTRLLDSIMLNAPGGDWVITSALVLGYLYTLFNPTGDPVGPWNANDGLAPAPVSALSTCGESGSVVWRVAVTDADAPDCSSCDQAGSVEQRLAAAIITDGTDSFILTIRLSDGEALDCDTAGTSWRTIMAGALSPIGECGMYALAVQK